MADSLLRSDELWLGAGWHVGIHAAIDADVAPVAKLDINDAALAPARKYR